MNTTNGARRWFLWRAYFSNGLVQPPTSGGLVQMIFLFNWVILKFYSLIFKGGKKQRLGEISWSRNPFSDFFLHFAGSTQTLDETLFLPFPGTISYKGNPPPPGFLEKTKG